MSTVHRRWSKYILQTVNWSKVFVV